MSHLDIDTVLGWRGRTVRDPDGEKVGTFGDVFLDSRTDLPAWGGVRTGLFGHRESYVPLDRMDEEGDDLRVPFAKDAVKDAPRIDPDAALSPEEEQRLYEHYGQAYVPIEDDPGAMTRSEEEVETGTTPMRPAERVRLRKVLVTEDHKQTVPVRREVVQLEHEPPPEGRIESVEDAGEQPPRT
jgi:Domain of unknown function (DUF2382)/PRC-barrel domain